MSFQTPYQPLLLRILHNASGLLAIGAWLTGFLVYNTYDRRFGGIPFPKIDDIQGIHGTLGLFFLLVFPFLAIYSFHWGSKKLLSANFAKKMTQNIGQPTWWINWQRITNTSILLAATLSVMSGRMMKEAWLPAEELHHVWYNLHLIAWVIFFFSLVAHIAMSWRVGGISLLRSMLNWRYRASDSPSLWLHWLRSRLRR